MDTGTGLQQIGNQELITVKPIKQEFNPLCTESYVRNSTLIVFHFCNTVNRLIKFAIDNTLAQQKHVEI